MPVAANEALFSIIGVTYGGDGTKVFALPNMPAPVKGLSYIMATAGIFPSRS